MRLYTCGVPKDKCQGFYTPANGGLGKGVYAHGSNQQAFACHKAYLLSLGFKQIGSKEFVDPETGYVRVLTRPGKFGGILRKGKTGEKGGGAGKRVVPKVGKKSKSGFIAIY